MNATEPEKKILVLDEDMVVPVLKKCSDEWCKEEKILVMDPDGWDRTNYDESWAEEITLAEFNKRVSVSTCQHRYKPDVKPVYSREARKARTSRQMGKLANKISTMSSRVAFFNVGRNFRCPCGSRKKFKHCCITLKHDAEKVVAKMQKAMEKLVIRRRTF